MREVVFCRTRHVYDSYIDFWRLVEAARFKVIHVDELDKNDAGKLYVFTPINGEIMPKLEEWRSRRARIIWWNLERWADETRERSMAAVAGAVDQIWVSDHGYAARDARLTYVLMAGHKDAATRVLTRAYDVCHLAYLWGRRKEAVDAMKERGLSIAPEAWGRGAQDQTVAVSHLVVNMHQYEGMNVVAPLRFAMAASYAIPIISEPFGEAPVADLVLAQAPLWQLPQLADAYVKDRDRLRVAGHRLFERLCMETDFELQVRYAASKVS